jgi:aspartate aminotransferase-like enzyme
MPRFYFDWAQAKRFAERGATPWTPAVSLFYALRQALQILLAEGLEQGYARHRRITQYTRQGLRRLGIRLFASDQDASCTVTAAWVPEGTTSTALRARLRDEFGIVLAGGQGPYEDTLFRIGHLGYVTEANITPVLDALAAVLGRDPARAG